MKHFFRKLYRSWLFEALLIALLLLVAFAYLNREHVAEVASLVSEWVSEKGPGAVTGFLESLATLLSPKVLLLMGGGLAVVLLVLWRILWRIRKSPKFKTNTCPRCSQPLVRIHRKGWQKAVSKVLPLRRLYCRKCGWRGLRFKEVSSIPSDSNGTGETTKYNIDKIKG